MNKIEYAGKALFALACGLILLLSFFNPWMQTIKTKTDAFVQLPNPQTSGEIGNYCQRARTMVVSYYAAVREMVSALRFMLIAILTIMVVDLVKETRRRQQVVGAGDG